MQRRAAAAYLVFFLVVGMAAYTFIGAAQQPQVALDGTAIEANHSANIEGTNYTVGAISHGSSGGHGGGGGQLEAPLTWTNETTRHTEALANATETTYDGESYTVAIPNETNVSTFALVEAFDVDALLANDTAVDDETVLRNGTEHVVYRQSDRIEPLSEYLPPRETRGFALGDAYAYNWSAANGTVAANVSAITPDGVTLSWIAPGEESVDLSEGANVTLADGGEYFVHFPNDHEVQIVPRSQYGEYATTLDRQAYFKERMNGLWGIVIMSGLAAMLFVMMAYMPVRG